MHTCTNETWRKTKVWGLNRKESGFLSSPEGALSLNGVGSMTQKHLTEVFLGLSEFLSCQVKHLIL